MWSAVIVFAGGGVGAILRELFMLQLGRYSNSFPFDIFAANLLASFLLGLVFCLNIETLRQWLSKLLETEIFPPEVYFLSRMPAEINPNEVTAVVLMALFLSFAATLYPAWRAASLDPVEALRYE